jgi:hypothetical protein
MNNFILFIMFGLGVWFLFSVAVIIFIRLDRHRENKENLNKILDKYNSLNPIRIENEDPTIITSLGNELKIPWYNKPPKQF